MSHIPHHVGPSGAGVPQGPTSDIQNPQTADASNDPPLSETQGTEREGPADGAEYQAAKRTYLADFAKQPVDAPGFGSNETEFSKDLKQKMADNGLPVPSAQTVQTLHAAVGDTPEFNELVGEVAGALQGENEVPSPEHMAGMIDKTLKKAPSGGKPTIGAAAPTPQSESPTVGAEAPTDSAASPKKAPESGASEPADGTATPAASGDMTPTRTLAVADGAKDGGVDSLLANTGSVSGLVFLVMLEAQKETNKEKSDTLREIKKYNGMLQALNNMINDQLIPAQKTLAQLKNDAKAGGDKDVDPQTTLNWPTHIDTDNALQDAETGEIVLNVEYGDENGSSMRLVNSTDLGILFSEADQTRTSIQNNQTLQSNRFQAKDNQASSGWNIINAVLKNTQEGVTGITRNV